MKTIFALAVLLAMTGCTSTDTAGRALAGAGYHDVKITGHNFFGCDHKDFYGVGFEAVGPSGVQVSGTVCTGWFKGATIRTD